MNRLNFLIRKNRGKKELKVYSEKLSAILKVSISEHDFLSLEQSDELSDQYYDDYKRKVKKIDKIVEFNDFTTIEELIKKELLPIKDLTDKTYLISRQSEFCGILVTTLKICLENKNIQRLIELDGDSLCLMTDDKRVAIYIDYYGEYVNGVETFYYHVSLW